MNCKVLLLSMVLAILAGAVTTSELKPAMEQKMEDSTESPTADMAMIDAELKTSTERSPMAPAAAMTEDKIDKKDTQRHTVADFIIHPLIAFKPHSPEELNGEVKQATDGSSTTTPSPWQLFGFNTGQGLGSSVSSLAGSVTGWLNDRIQLPGLVDSPIRESTSTSTSTTTTQRPDVVVRVQHKSTTRRPIININNRNRPHRFNNNNLNFDSEEDDDYFDDEQYDNDEEDGHSNEQEYDDDVSNPPRRPNRVTQPNRQNKRQRPQFQEEYDDSQSEENDDDVEDDDDDDDHDHDDHDHDHDHDEDDEGEDEEEEEVEQRPNRRRPVQNSNNRRRQQQNTRPRNPQRNRVSVGSQRQQGVASASASSQRRQQQQQHAASAEEEEESAEAEVEADDNDEQFFHGSRPSTKRSQSAQNNFIQRGQQSLINQIRQLTRGQTPAELSAAMRKSQQQQQQQKEQAKKRRRNQATLVVNRNGQTIYMAPELLNAGESGALLNPNLQYYTQALRADGASQQFPQPPLTVPLKRKGRPTQYITIPWSQLGIAPPDQVVAITEGVQSKPLILNIPQSAIHTMQSPSRKKRPLITPDAVPLLAEASLMDVFKPPKIPPSRHSTAAPSHKPMIIASKPKPASSGAALLPHRIRPATIVEKAPASMEMVQEETAEEDSNEPTPTVLVQTNDELRNSDSDFIIVGEDNEPGLTRQVQPVYGEARYVYGDGRPYLEVLNRRRFALHKAGRALELPEAGAAAQGSGQQAEQLIPVQIITEPQQQQSNAVREEAAVEQAIVEEAIAAPAETSQQPMQANKTALPDATT